MSSSKDQGPPSSPEEVRPTEARIQGDPTSSRQGADTGGARPPHQRTPEEQEYELARLQAKALREYDKYKNWREAYQGATQHALGIVKILEESLRQLNVVQQNLPAQPESNTTCGTATGAMITHITRVTTAGTTTKIQMGTYNLKISIRAHPKATKTTDVTMSTPDTSHTQMKRNFKTTKTEREPFQKERARETAHLPGPHVPQQEELDRKRTEQITKLINLSLTET
ncbi:hypothetical protein QAD02_007496 [Eretmocerus hayati]|uniref:Uncharacterized protein n=1 Tax=Eretmocerus hayati TaxID=131215 RepID=A0ACC2N444_9HYME|nr:hypothetical protein QAD02_007496 [Eretmocerus hayati]